LAEFEALDFQQADLAAQVWGCVGQSTAFYRHYIDDAVADQRRYGALLGRMMQALDPGISPRSLRTHRRRIGFCGAYFRAHTVTRLFAPLIEALAEHDFELEVFALAGTRDGWGERLHRVARVHDQPRQAAEWRTLIAERELDVLVHIEIGMHPLAQGLAAIRLAPVQATLWGHPVTTGLASIDHMLSPDAMEPADGQAFYSERLLRLPGLGHGLQATDQPVAQPVELDERDPARIDLLCAQTVYKLLPEQDELFGRILARLPQARLHLLADDRAAVRDWLQARMTPTLRACGADPERQLRIHGFLPLAQFLGLAGACRLNLDSIGWSGGMSALDLLGQGLPTLTLEGRSMRTRQTAALLQRLDVGELIAENPDEYVEKAVALAGDNNRLQHLRQRILAARHRLFADRTTLAALADFLATVEAPEPR
jgi:predicted O-linked N-acetylglucosamine transferase (SPINDLY family)